MTTANPIDGLQVADAEALYRQILTGHPMGRLPVRGWGGAKLIDFCDPAGWLGLWMLRAEINSMALLGCRLWDTVYQASDKAAEGVLPVNRELSELEDELESTYTNQTLGDSKTLTGALRYVLARQGMEESILIVENAVDAKPVELPGYSAGLSVGDVLPFPDQVMCVGALLSEFTDHIHREFLRIQAQRRRDQELHDEVRMQ